MASRKRLPTFYKFYFGIILVVLMAIIVGMIWLTGLLSEYEDAQPYNVADEIFEKYYLSENFETLAEITHDDSLFDSSDAVAKYLAKNYPKDTLTYTSVSSGDKDVMKYIVKSGDKKISAFTLKKSGETTERGFDLYEKDSFEVFYNAKESVTVLVPENSQVLVNERELDESFIVDSGVVLVNEKELPKGITPPKFTRYKVEGLLEKPALKVMTAGAENTTEYDGDAKEYRSPYPNNEALAAEHTEFVLAAIKEYARYVENDGGFARVRPYLDSTSDLYDSVRTVGHQYVHPHTGYRFEDEWAKEFYSYDENTFSCRVHVLQVLENYGMEDFKDKVDLTMYLRRVGNRFLIYDWTLMGD